MSQDLKSKRVLVTPTSYAKNDPRLLYELEQQVGEVIYNPTQRPLTSTEVRDLLPGINGYIAGLDVIDKQALEAADLLQVIARYGVGLDNLDLDFTRKKGIVVTYTPGANSVSVAELTVGLILSLARQIPTAVIATRSGEWPRFSGITLENKIVGLIGLGSIGKQTALRLKSFNCHLLVYEPYPDMQFVNQNQIELANQDKVLQSSDFVSLHLPLVPDTRKIVNTKFINKMKTGAYLINTARGELVDETSLIQSLQTGKLAGAAIDVFSKEPPDPQSPLLKMPNVIVTPHCASHTDGATNAMGWMALNDCLAVLRGEEPKYPIK